MKNIFSIVVFTLPVITAFTQKEFWGTSATSGTGDFGFIYKTDSTGNNLVIMHHFDSVNGKAPGTMILASNHKLYGIAEEGGQNSGGTYLGGVFYEYDLTTNVYTVIQAFGPGNTTISGARPQGWGTANLVEGLPGIIYGQIRGNNSSGVVFRYDTQAQSISTAVNIPTFIGGLSQSQMPNLLSGALYKHTDGYLYGATSSNSACPIGNPHGGSIVRIDPVSFAYSIQYLADCPAFNGMQYKSGFATYNNQLYSVTNAGGSHQSGVLYAFDPATSALVKKHDFQGGIMGGSPYPPVMAPNGKMYGLAFGGTPETGFPNGCGILYEFDPATDIFTKKLDFTYGNGWIGNVGPHPHSLIDGYDGHLYGASAYGVFKYDITTNTTSPEGRFPYQQVVGIPFAPTLLKVCRKPSYQTFADTSVALCKGNAFTYSIHSDNSTSVSWLHNGIAEPSQGTSVLSFSHVSVADTGTWTAVLTNECGSTTTSSIRVTFEGFMPVITQNTADLVSSAGSQYQWIDCNNNNTPLAGETGQVFTPSQQGNYAVIVTGNGCTDTSACFTFYMLGNGNAAEQPDIRIAPNPVTDQLQIISGTPVISAAIFDVTGRKILTVQHSTVIPVSMLDNGNYFLVITTEGRTWNGKFIKQ